MTRQQFFKSEPSGRVHKSLLYDDLLAKVIARALLAKDGDVCRGLTSLPGLGQKVSLGFLTGSSTARAAAHPAKAPTQVGQGTPSGVVVVAAASLVGPVLQLVPVAKLGQQVGQLSQG